MTKIMIVEDSHLSGSVIANYIQKMNRDFEVIRASNGAEAVDKYTAEKPDLVFMDIEMPEMDGLRASEKIIEINKFAKIVIVTSHHNEIERDKAMKIGVKDFITKPIQHDKIVDAINKYI